MSGQKKAWDGMGPVLRALKDISSRQEDEKLSRDELVAVDTSWVLPDEETVAWMGVKFH